MKTIFTLLMVISFPGMAFHSQEDSVQLAQKVKTLSGHARFTARIHSMGQFNYGGRIVSENPTVDINFTYNRKAWGFQFFKAMDLVDRNTQINFALAVLNKTFHVGKRLTITPNVGFILEQSNTMADKGSDLTFILNSSYKLTKNLTIEHSSLLGNVALEPNERDWVNRIRLLYSEKHWDFMAMGWHNNKVFDSAEYITYGAGISYSRMKLSPWLTMNAGITGILMPYSNDTVDYPKRDGLIFTLAMVIE